MSLTPSCALCNLLSTAARRAIKIEFISWQASAHYSLISPMSFCVQGKALTWPLKPTGTWLLLHFQLPFFFSLCSGCTDLYYFFEQSKTFLPQGLCIIIPLTQNVPSSCVFMVCDLTFFLSQFKYLPISEVFSGHHILNSQNRNKLLLETPYPFYSALFFSTAP